MRKSTFAACVLAFQTLFACFVATSAHAQSPDMAVIARFIGTWVEDVSKRDVSGLPHLRFQQNAAGGLEEARGPEQNPLLHPVIFDGKSHEVPGGGNRNRITWKEIDSRTFERVLTNTAGRVLSIRRLAISADGKALTEEEEVHQAEGQNFTNTVTFQRVGGGPHGLLGRWKPVSYKTSSPRVLRFDAAGANGFTFTDVEGTTTLTLDDKPMPTSGPNNIVGTMTAAKRIDDYTIQFRQGRDGVLSDKIVRTVARDGKTMTTIITRSRADGSSESGSRVHVKE